MRLSPPYSATVASPNPGPKVPARPAERPLCCRRSAASAVPATDGLRSLDSGSELEAPVGSAAGPGRRRPEIRWGRIAHPVIGGPRRPRRLLSRRLTGGLGEVVDVGLRRLRADQGNGVVRLADGELSSM